MFKFHPIFCLLGCLLYAGAAVASGPPASGTSGDSALPAVSKPAFPLSASGANSGLFGGAALTNPNLSLVLDFTYYQSRLSNEVLEERSLPGYVAENSELRTGFNLEAAELFFFAPVDPYFNLYAAIPVSSEGAELEEAYAITSALPFGLQVKLGRFKSGFSRLNAQHPHAWDFADLPLAYRAFLGSEGSGGDQGTQVSWLMPLPVYALLGAEVFQGGNPLLFGDAARSGPHAITGFFKLSLDTTDDSILYAGPYLLFGSAQSEEVPPAANSDAADGTVFRGDSFLYGLEAVWKWDLAPQEGVTVQGEYLIRTQRGDLQAGEVSESLSRNQDGAYLQGLFQWNRRWRAGARYDRLGIFRDRVDRAGVAQAFGPAPWRATASLEYNATEFTRVRLQYTHDRSDRQDRSSDEGLLQVIFGIGAHAAHAF